MEKVVDNMVDLLFIQTANAVKRIPGANSQWTLFSLEKAARAVVDNGPE